MTEGLSPKALEAMRKKIPLQRYGEADAYFREAFDAAEAAGAGNAMAHMLFLRGNVAREKRDYRASDAFEGLSSNARESTRRVCADLEGTVTVP